MKGPRAASLRRRAGGEGEALARIPAEGHNEPPPQQQEEGRSMNERMSAFGALPVAANG
jgi:hypothetical protein